MSEIELEPLNAAARDPIYKVFVGGLSVNCEDRELREYLQQFGQVTDCEIIRDKQGKSKGYCFATYADRAGQLRSIGKNHVLQGKIFEIREQLDSDKNSELLSEIAKRKLFISNLKANIDEDDLLKYFSRFGAIEEVLISRDPATQQSKGFGFVKFSEECSTREVLQGQERRIIKVKNQEITIKPCIPKPQMTKLKKFQKADDALSFYKPADFEDTSDPFAIYGSPTMAPGVHYNQVMQTPNYLLGPQFAMPHAQSLVTCSASYPYRMMSAQPWAPELTPQDEKKSLFKHLNVKSSSFTIQTKEVTSPEPVAIASVLANKTGQTASSKLPAVTPIKLDFQSLPLPTQARPTEERIKQVLEAETAANSLAGSFASQDSQASSPESPSDSLACRCGVARERLLSSSNVIENVKKASCAFGSFGFDSLLTSAGLVNKPSATLGKRSNQDYPSIGLPQSDWFHALLSVPTEESKPYLAACLSQEEPENHQASAREASLWDTEDLSAHLGEESLFKAFF
jgi:hypothetical protein